PLLAPNTATSSEPGGRPASIPTSSTHASTCRRSGAAGVHDARNSICAPSPSSESEPKPLESILVEVPDAEWYVASRDSSASTSHDQVTSASSGSVPISGSSGACAKAITRQAPFHAEGSSGSNSSTKRPEP